jgi:hypothetical protein
MVYSGSLEKLGELERECRQWANVAIFLKTFSHYSPLRVIRVKDFLDLERAMNWM